MKQIETIRLKNVSKEYTIHHEKPTLVERFVKERNERFFALRDIKLTVHKGEKVGIVGKNGSGKTTLLKIIAGITKQSSGIVKTNGIVVSLIDLEAGFHPDLTGVQNIYLNGMLLGMTKKEVTNHLQSIIAFAGVRQFIDAPLYTYSQGMKLRLGFSVAIHANPDILILDEGISVGDKEFQEKSQKKIAEFFRLNKTVLVVTHWLEFLKKNCTRILVLEKGCIISDGGPRLLDEYEAS